MLVDSDILIDLVRQHEPAREWLAGLAEVPSITGVAVVELAFGCRSGADLVALRQFLLPFPVIWPNEDDFRVAYSEFAPLRLATGIGALDAVTAAVARRSGGELATFNVRHFRSVPELRVVQPYER